MPEEQAPNVGESIEAVAGLLTGQSKSVVADAPTESPPIEETGSEEDAGAPDLTPAGLAKHLGLKPDELFKQFRIPVDGGDPITLEEFKEAGKQLREVNAATEKLAEERISHENGVMQQRQTLQRALAKIPEGSITPELIQEVQQEHTNHVQGQRRELVAIRPDLAEPAKWQATHILMEAHLKPYGFSSIEVSGIIDHRMAKYVIDNAEREKRVKELSANGIQVTETAKLSAPSSSPAKVVRRADKEQPRRGAAKVGDTKTNQDKASEVAQLLGAL